MSLNKNLLLVLSFVFIAFTSYGQNQTKKVTPGDIWYWEYLPPDYNSNTDDYPIVLFMHGMGERGNVEADMNKVLNNGPPEHVKNGVDFPFILISPQLKTSKSNWSPWYMDDVFEHVKTYLRIDLNRVYVTGLSLGGGGAWLYARDYSAKIAALAPICGSIIVPNQACNIVNENVPVWAFHGDADGTVSVNKSISMINSMNNCDPPPNPAPILTIYPGVGHNSWDRAYRIDNSLHTPNLYEWMLAQSRSSITADAGSDLSLSLPTTTANLSGSGSSTAAIMTYLWEQVSGPTAVLTNANTSTVSVSGMVVAGTYAFRFTVTDTDGNSASDNVSITVSGANVAPVASAGADKTIKLPVNSVSVTGSGSDTDGSIASYSWVKLSGPTATISSPSSASTNITGMSVGVYTFQLTVTDDDGATGTDEMMVTVNEADNVAPVANAGPNQTINLPTNSLNIAGSGSDTDGTITTYFWEKVGGPTATMNNINSATLSLSNLGSAIYTFRLTVTDDDGATDSDDVKVTVLQANQAPVVNAGADQSITQPTSSTNLTGTASDSDGTIASYLWEFVSGPATPSIANATTSTCTANNLSAAGSYIFKLTATDDDGASSSDNVTVTVNAAPVNSPPTANAGTDKNITLPVSSVVLNGSGSDSDGTIASYLWSKLSGGTASLAGTTTQTLNVTNLEAGSYVFRLRVTDDDGATATDDVAVTVNPAAVNESPTVNAGADKVVTLPVANVVFNGSATDNDGTISSYSWVKLTGPSVTLSGASTATLTLTNVVEGVYTFELTAVDDDGASGSDIVQLTANAINAPPVASAGADQVITLPTNSLTINGTATDSDGSVVSYSWTQESGPSVANYSGANTPNFFVTNMVAGIYTFRFLVTDDDGATHFDEVNVTVNDAANVSPTANAGSDKSINLPTNSLNITGFASDSDGTIASTVWTLINGPSSVVFANENTLTVSVSSLQEGVYTFRLTVTDDDGAIGFDDMDVTVIPEVVNTPPTANAGANQTLTLPTNSTTIAGSGTDPDGTIASYLWSKVGGPAATLSNTSTSVLSVSNLIEGSYTFRLVVTDNDGAQGMDDMTVNVLPAVVNNPPTANAGSDIQLVLPTNSTNLVGLGSDPDGGVVTYAWTKLTGPAATLTNASSSTVTVSGLVEGSYEFELTVTDDKGATSSDQVIVTVLPMNTNTAPTANAGQDLSITLPTNSTTINGSGSDSDGSIVRYTWSKTSGGAAVLANPNVASLAVSGLVEGTYVFELEVEDDDGATHQDQMTLTVLPAQVNNSPTANAGSDKTIQLPTNSVNLAGNGTDSDGTVASFMWTKVSGGTATIVSPSTKTTSVTSLVAGTYVFRLTVTDDDGAIGTDEVTINVLAEAANQAPTALAGADKSIKLPTNSVVITGGGTDADGTIASYSWTQVSGPTATLTNTTASELTVNDMLEGTYVFKLTVTDDDGATGSDNVTVTVVAASTNLAPTISVGSTFSVELPQSDVNITATISDDGTIASIDWVVNSGPNTPTLTGNGTATINLAGLVEGTYSLTITATDDGGLTATKNVQVSVLPENTAANQPPTVDAGADLTVSDTEVILNAIGDDPDGLVRDFTWSQVDGPGTATLTPGSEGVVTISNLVVGTYTFSITVSDFEDATGSDEINVTVVESPDAIIAPKLFSPNNDGTNDFWEIGNLDAIANCTLIIFDRKGSIVFETVGYQNNWDGTRNGEALPEGVYYYVIRCNGKQNDKTGSITLLR